MFSNCLLIFSVLLVKYYLLISLVILHNNIFQISLILLQSLHTSLLSIDHRSHIPSDSTFQLFFYLCPEFFSIPIHQINYLNYRVQILRYHLASYNQIPFLLFLKLVQSLLKQSIEFYPLYLL